ncbi:MAG: DUF4065 domain-containing protein [Methanobrevibacter sp.]|nr:DUF4065 domain-containing protein [Methanobrevibacter sp.]
MDLEKFKEVLHYIIHECDTKEKIFLYNILYFSDFNYYELYEKSLTNESYRKLPRGPAPIHFDAALKELMDEGKINVTTKNISIRKS